MRGLIKAGAGLPAHDWIGPASQPLGDPREDEIARLNDQLAQMATALEAARAAGERHDKERRKAFEDGKAAGEEAGRRLAEDGTASRLKALQDGIEHALHAFGDEMANLEGLAALVAQAGLARIFEPGPQQRDILLQTVRRQLRGLEARAIISIEVSAADFPDDGALAQFAQALDRRDVAVQALAALSAGQCRVRLVLGALEIGPAQQWDRLKGLLEDLSREGGER